MAAVEKYGVIGASTQGRIVWFDTAEQLAASWHEYPNARLRILRDGKVGLGTAAEVAPVYDALKKPEV